MLETVDHFISLLIALNDFKFSLIRHLFVAPAKFSIGVELFFFSNTLGAELRSLITFTNLKSKRTELVKKQLADYIYFFSAKTCFCLLHFCLFEVSVERIDYEEKKVPLVLNTIVIPEDYLYPHCLTLACGTSHRVAGYNTGTRSLRACVAIHLLHA
jgi:hypothetical protein